VGEHAHAFWLDSPELNRTGGQVLYLGEIKASQRETWRKTIELQDASTRRQVALFCRPHS
jgi:hypothetical protein